MKLLIVLAYLFSHSQGPPPVKYESDTMLAIMGQGVTTQTYKDFKTYWLIAKDEDVNRNKGIQLYVSPITDNVEGINITGESVDLSDLKLKKCTAKLPLGITLDDDTATLSNKLGWGEKLLGRNALRYHNGNMAIEATYNNLKTGKIALLKFTTEGGKPAVICTSASNSKKDSIAAWQLRAQQVIIAAIKAKEKPKDTVVRPPFKQAILNIFAASRESTFDSIKTTARTDANFWNYKYTFSTNIKIPGEKYNMLYSFPFANSQVDFVSVLKESDFFEKSFDVMYHDFEKQLTDNFPSAEGWVASYLPGKDKNRLANFELRNDKYGAIILDHTQNPAGKHILYLRFLLFSD